MKNIDSGNRMYEWARSLFPICRSITGEGVRETLAFIKKQAPELTIKALKSGTEVFDWTIPQEWLIRDAYIITPSGDKIACFKDSNLHVVGYSSAINQVMSLEDLEPFLYSLPDMPSAIPYVTSYYQRCWGFCLSQEDRNKLTPGDYHVVIDSEHFDGELNYGEIILPGSSDKEVLISTYICHPSLANNELSGPVVTLELFNKIKQMKNRKYTYRFVFIPETIGSISYLSLHYQSLKENVVAGFVVTCVGDDRAFSYLPSRHGSTLADKAALLALEELAPNYLAYSFLDRGSDERQYCAPGIDLPVCSIMRSKYGEYPEYHTSLDNLSLISPAGLAGALKVIYKAIEYIEINDVYQVTVLCEPQLGKRGLYPTLSSTMQEYDEVITLTNFLAYCDGKHDLFEIAKIIKTPLEIILPHVKRLAQEGLITKVKTH